MKRATMQQTEIQQSFSAAMKTSESQAQIFNNKLGETADQLRIALLPALKDLAPAAIALAGAFTAVIGKLTGATEEKKQITYEDALKHAKEARESGDPVKIRAAQKEVEQVLGQHEKARYDLRHPDEQYNSLGFRKDTPFWMYATGLAGIDSVPTKLVRDNLPGMDIPGLGYVGGSLERKRNEMSAEDWRIDQLKEEQHATSQALANLVSGLLRDGLKIQNLPPQGPTPQPPGAGFGGVMPPGAR